MPPAELNIVPRPESSVSDSQPEASEQFNPVYWQSRLGLDNDRSAPLSNGDVFPDEETGKLLAAARKKGGMVPAGVFIDAVNYVRALQAKDATGDFGAGPAVALPINFIKILLGLAVGNVTPVQTNSDSAPKEFSKSA